MTGFISGLFRCSILRNILWDIPRDISSSVKIKKNQYSMKRTKQWYFYPFRGQRTKPPAWHSGSPTKVAGLSMTSGPSEIFRLKSGKGLNLISEFFLLIFSKKIQFFLIHSPPTPPVPSVFLEKKKLKLPEKNQEILGEKIRNAKEQSWKQPKTWPRKDVFPREDFGKFKPEKAKKVPEKKIALQGVLPETREGVLLTQQYTCTSVILRKITFASAKG